MRLHVVRHDVFDMSDEIRFPMSDWTGDQIDAVRADLDRRAIPFRVDGDELILDSQFAWFVNAALGTAVPSSTSPSGPPSPVERVPTPTAPPPAVVSADRSSRRWGAIAAAAGAVAVIAGAVAIWQFIGGDDAGSQSAETAELPPTAVTAPVGAIAAQVSDSRFVETDESVQITTATCPGILAAVAAEECVELTEASGEPLGAVTVERSGDDLSIVLRRFVADTASIIAASEWRADYPSSDLAPGGRRTLEVFSSDQWPHLVVVADTVEDDDAPISAFAEMVQMDEIGDSGVAATFSAAGIAVSTDATAVYVVADRYRDADEPCCPSGRVLHSLYDVAGSWSVTNEALNDDELAGRLSGTRAAATVTAQVSVPVPTTTTTTTQPPETLPPPPAEPDIARLSCMADQWITVIGSFTAAAVESAARNFSGVGIGRTADMCPSICVRR